MNVAQQILAVILKMMYYEDFKSSLTSAERDFIQSLRSASCKYFRISSLGRKTIFTWESGIGESAACYVSDDGFHFSETLAYKASNKRIKDRPEEKLSAEKVKILQEETDELKKIFRIYSQDVEVYFK